MSYEAWRISFQSSEQAAKAAYAEWQKAQEQVKKWKALANAAAAGFEIAQFHKESMLHLDAIITSKHAKPD